MRKIAVLTVSVLTCATAFANNVWYTSAAAGDASAPATWGKTEATQIPNDFDAANVKNYAVTFSAAGGTFYLSQLTSNTNIAAAQLARVTTGANLVISGTNSAKPYGVWNIAWNNNANYDAVSQMLIEGGTVHLKAGGTSNFNVASAQGVDVNTTGTLTIAGGTVIIDGSVVLANTSTTSATATASLYLNGGALYVLSTRGDAQVGIRSAVGSGTGTGTFNWAGGDLAICRAQENLTNTGSGNLVFKKANYTFTDTTDAGTPDYRTVAFSATGGTTYLMTGMANAVTYTQGADASLTANVSNSTWGGWDCLMWYDTTKTTTESQVGHTVNLISGTTIRLNILDDFDMTVGQGINIIATENLLIDGVAATTEDLSKLNIIVNGAAAFDASVMRINNDTISALRLVYTGIPEPAAVAGLLGLAALAFAARRRQ